MNKRDLDPKMRDNIDTHLDPFPEMSEWHLVSLGGQLKVDTGVGYVATLDSDGKTVYYGDGLGGGSYTVKTAYPHSVASMTSTYPHDVV